MNDIKKQIQEKIADIEKELQKENDILLKLDKKRGIVKVYSQQVKRRI